MLASRAVRRCGSPQGIAVAAQTPMRSFHHNPANRSATQTSQTPAIEAVMQRRAQAGKFAPGVAAASDSDMFKGPQGGKPKAKRWDNHLSDESRARVPCTLKQAAKFLKQPGLVSLGGGLPSSSVFPFESFSMKVPVPPNFSEKETSESGIDVTIGKYDVRDKEGTYDLSIALNYGQATGAAQMMRFLTEHTEIVSNPPYADWRICQTIGSTGALEQAVRMFCDSKRGDSVLTEEFSFSTALETIAPLGIKAVGVPIDDEGLIPEAMDELLSNWDAKARGYRKPHVLYTVPSGQNPTGATQGAERRKAVYKVAQKHDIFIIEDEPYFFLQMEPYKSNNKALTTTQEFLDSLLPTFVSMDVDGRVMRLDSSSKVLIPGSRHGWIVASEQIVERYQRHAEVASQGPSGISQIVLHKLLDETWGHEGYLKWLMNLRTEYTGKRDVMLRACETHVPGDLVTWTPPAAGMFMWLTVDHTKYPDASKSIEQMEEEIFNACIKNNVLVARGSWFSTETDKPLNSLHFRVTYAMATPEGIDVAISRFGQSVKECFGRQ